MAQQVVGNLSPKIDDSVSKAMRKGAANAPGISLNDAASIHRTLKETNEKIDIRNQVDKLRKTNTRFVIGLIILFNVSVILGLWNHNLRKERNELSRIEWLYRGLRSMINPKDTVSLYGMEQSILLGTKEQLESWQTTIVNHEANGIPFHHFQPHDDWQPEPPKPKDEKPNPKKGAEIDRFPLPHSRERRLTPGEVQAINDMRANPHIPEDAKPPLPEGY